MSGRKNKAIEYCAYGLLLLVIFILQSSRGTAVTVWGFRMDLIPFFVTALALFKGPYAAGGFGFAAGLLCASNSPILDGLYATYYGLLGAACGVFALRYMRRVLPSAMLLGLGASMLKGVIAYLFYYGLVYQAPIGRMALLVLGDTVLSAIPSVLIFFAIRAIDLRFMEKDET